MMTTKLTDIQTALLEAANTRDGGSLLPLPATMTMSTGLRRSIASLVTRGLAKEVTAAVDETTWRMEDDRQVGIAITDAGRAAIGAPVPMPTTASPQPAVTKIALVTGMLRRPDGATVAELIAATGWLPHTTRAALTGLRKKGHDIARVRRNDVTVYSIVGVA